MMPAPHVENSVINAPTRTLREPPLLPGLPVLGSTLPMLRDPLTAVLDGYKRLGPAFRVRVIGREMVILGGPEALRDVKDAGPNVLLAGPQYAFFNRELGTDRFILAMDGPLHVEMRKLLSRGYGKQAALDALGPMTRFAERELLRWPQGEPIDVVLRMKELVVRQLSLSLLGHDPGELLGDLQTFFTTSVRVYQYKALPRLALRLPRYRRAVDRLYDVTREIVRAHQAHRAAGHARADGESPLLDDLLGARDAQGRAFEPHVHRAVVVGAILAGLDTVAITASFALYALLAHPEVLTRARAEVDAIAAQGELDAARLESAEYLHAVLLESLRKYPIMAGMARVAGEDFEVNGCVVRRGREVLLSPVVGHFLAKFFPEPERFDPTRMLAPRMEHRQKFAFAPFGIGSHTCLGAGFGEVELVALLFSILKTLDLELSPKDYALRVAIDVTRRPAHDFRVRVRGHRRAAV
ncbi:MAG: cytochrome P450 [Polyangiaceae bacterium]